MSLAELGSKRTTILAVLAGLALCTIVLVRSQSQEGASAGVVATASHQISKIELSASLKSSTVVEDAETQVRSLIKIRGGPGPVTLGGQFPREEGGVYEASVTIMLDRDAVYGFDLPVHVGLKPGTYDVTVKAASFDDPRVSSTQTVRLTVTPKP